MEGGDAMKMNLFLIDLTPTMLVVLMSTNVSAQQYISELGMPTEYSTVSALDCGNTKIQVRTYCEQLANGAPGCFLQKATFANSSNGSTFGQLFLYERYKKDLSLISTILCVQKKNGVGVVLASTNLGNCKVCEWEDYFDTSGKLLGSTRTKFGPTNIGLKRLPMNFYQTQGWLLDDRGRLVEIGKASVSRKQP